MILKQCYMTDSTCYRQAGNSVKTGIVVHSTGCNNPYIKRYVQPLKTDACYSEVIADIGRNIYGNDWNHIERYAGVHAFIGKNAKGIVETYQVLPYEKDAWGVGRGPAGSYNFAPDARIQFEICEDNLRDGVYFNAAMKEAQEYCAYLCKLNGWGTNQICSHNEAYYAGYSLPHHVDPDHWLYRFGRNMDWFRAEVQKIIDGGAADEPTKEEQPVIDTLQVGDRVSMTQGAPVYGKTRKFASWVYKATLYVRQISGDRVVVSIQNTGAVTGAVDRKYLTKI